MTADFLFLRFVAAAFQGAAFGYNHRSSGVSEMIQMILYVVAADDAA